MSPISRLELLSSLRGRVTERIDCGDTPIGKRLDAYFEGDLTGVCYLGRCGEWTIFLPDQMASQRST